MELTEAEWHSPALPEDLECDGCQAVSYQFHKAFDKVHTIRNMLEGDGKRLPDHEVIDMAGWSKVCFN